MIDQFAGQAAAGVLNRMLAREAWARTSPPTAPASSRAAGGGRSGRGGRCGGGGGPRAAGRGSRGRWTRRIGVGAAGPPQEEQADVVPWRAGLATRPAEEAVRRPAKAA